MSIDSIIMLRYNHNNLGKDAEYTLEISNPKSIGTSWFEVILVKF